MPRDMPALGHGKPMRAVQLPPLRDEEEETEDDASLAGAEDGGGQDAASALARGFTTSWLREDAWLRGSSSGSAKPGGSSRTPDASLSG